MHTGSALRAASLGIAVLVLMTTANAAAKVVPVITITETRAPANVQAVIDVLVEGRPYEPTGTLTLKEGNTVVGTSSTPSAGFYGIRVFFTTPGSHVLTASYSGDANHLPGQSSPATVEAIATSLLLGTAGPPGLAFGVRATATGAFRCIGTVALAEDGKALASKALDVATGTVEFLSSSYPLLTEGRHTINATFAVNSPAGCGPATSAPFPVYIGVPATVTEVVSIIPNPSRFGQLTHATVLVARAAGAAAGVASGRVTLKQGGVALASGDLDAAGSARLNLPSLPVGSWPLTAEYGGSATARASVSAPATLVINPAMIFLSAAGGKKTLAPNSLASAYGADLTSTTALATTSPLPTELGGVQVSLTGTDGTAQKAQLLYVSPQQINFLVPAQSRTGSVTIQVSRAQQTLFAEALIEAVAPSIFTADGSASGVPIAALVTVHGDGSQESRLVYDCAGGTCRAVELELAAGETNVLVLYATGIRNARLEDVTARAALIDLPVQYAGAQGDYVGLDQINLAVPAALAGRGAVTIEVVAAGKSANAVSLRFR